MSLTERTRELWSRAREEALYAKGHVLGMEHRAPPADAPLRRFVYGAALPFHVLRAVLAVPDARRAYGRVMFWQLLAMIPVGVVVCWMSIDSDDKHGFAHWLALASAIFSALSIAEWIIVALGREYHDHLSFAAAALTGAPHTVPSAAPRVHLDVGWLWLKGRRKLRSLLLIALAVPVCFLLSLVPGAGDWLYGVALGLWTFYWLSVFALANSDLAWHAPLAPAGAVLPPRQHPGEPGAGPRRAFPFVQSARPARDPLGAPRLPVVRGGAVGRRRSGVHPHRLRHPRAVLADSSADAGGRDARPPFAPLARSQRAAAGGPARLAGGRHIVTCLTRDAPPVDCAPPSPP